MNIPKTLPIPHPHATKEARTKVLTGTDMRTLMAGEWLKVWEEKRGLRQSEDLSHIFKVQLGLATEKLHARWHMRQTEDNLVEMPDQPCYTPHLDAVPVHHAATFDWWVCGDDIPLELKHTHERNNLFDAAEYYMAQLQWQLWVTGRQRLRFSIIRGNQEPEWGVIQRDEDYLGRLLAVAETFWDLVQTGVAPEDMEPDAEATKIAKAIPINGMKKYDHTTNNEWIVLEADYVAQKIAADQFKVTDKELRKLIPADALEVEGKLTRFKRDARGAYRCTILGE